MAQMMTVRLNRGDAPNWGFRLQGGKDFGTPLVVQKVNGGSPAERAGLSAGDSVIKINNTEVFNLRHKDAQDVIVRAGPTFEITVQRGGSTWRPSVQPVGSIYQQSTPSINNVQPVTKTSLAAKNQSNVGAIGTGHNLAAKPFNTYNGTSNGTGPRLVNKQYNSPVGLYSEESIKETISAQTEVLSGGCLGVNFKKNEKDYDSSNSAVYRMLQEAENDHNDGGETEPDSGVVTASNRGVAGLRHVAAPENKPQQPKPQLPPGQNICADCERLIVGVFVRIKDKNLHVECFKCATCGTSLKNVGYYNINNKLYCDIHAKLAAKNSAPGPNLLPVTVPPGGRIPAGTISAALSGHALPQTPLSPNAHPISSAPFSSCAINAPAKAADEDETAIAKDVLIAGLLKAAACKKRQNNEDDVASLPATFANCNSTNTVSINVKPINFDFKKPSANLSGPRPFSSVSAPLSSPSYKPSSVAPLSPVAPAPEKSERYVNIVWPPVPEHSDLPTACPLYFPPPSNVDHAPKEPQLVKAPDREQRAVEEVHESQSAMANAGTPKMSICSEEVYNLSGRRSTMECLETITDSIQTQIFVDGILKERPRSPPPPPVDRDITVQPTTQLQEKEQDVKQEDEQALRRSSVELRRPNDFERALKARKSLENVVPKQWESQMLRALTTISPPSSSSSSDAFAQIPAKHSRTPLAEALSIAPKESYLHLTTTLEAVPLPEETEPYFPPERPLVVADVGKKPPTEPPEDSKFVKALQTAPDRPFTPVKTAVKKKPRADPLLDDLPKPSEPMTMKAALTTASDRPYTPLVCDPFAVKPLESQAAKEEIKPPPSKPKAVDDRAVPKPFKPVAIETFVPCEEKDRPPSTGFPPVTDGLKAAFDECHADYSQIKSEISSQIVEQTHKEVHFDERSIVAHEEEEVDIEESALCKKCKCSISKKQRAEHKEEKLMRKEVVVEKQAECTVVKKPMNLIGCLHKPEGLPHYQLALDAPPIPMDFAAKRGNPQNVDGNRKPTGDTRNPGNNPNPGTNPHNPGTNPHNPGTNPHNPGTNPHNPGTNPAESNPRITVECETVQTPRRQPLITIDPHDYASGAFRPVADDSNRPGSGGTFSPRPGSLTPSMINKPAPKIPHYQANLVPTEHAAPEVNLFDPKSPAISRSPSPCPPRDRSPSPFRPNTPRPKSPAAVGPPPNPLKDSAQLRAMLQKETKETKEIEEAKRSLETFIPQHKELTEGQRMYAAEVSVRNKRYDDPQAVSQRYREEDVVVREQLHMEEQQQKLQQKLSMYKEQQLQRTEAEREERRTVGESTTSVKERSQMDRVQQTQKETSESVARSADSAVQVQRKRTVTEEFEHTHKEKTIEIQKGGAKTHAFARSSDPLADAPIQAAHVACPQPLDRKFVDKRHASAVDCNQQGVVGLTVTRPKPIASPFLGGGRSNSIPQVHAELNKQDVTVRSGIGIVASSSSAQERQSATQQTADYGKTLLAATSSSVASPSIPPSAPFKPAAKACVTPSKSASASTGPSACVKRPNNLSNPNNNRAGGGSGIGGGGAGGRQAGAIGVAPKRGRGVLNVGGLVGSRVPLCGSCHQSIRGPFITALGKIWCPDHFVCATPSCRRPLQDLGFVEERGQLYCEYCFEQYLAPNCSKCNQKIKGDCLKAIGQNFHPDCFKCIYCGKLFSNSPFFLEDGAPYCENDWNELFTTKCFACGFPVEAGDRWVEALNNNYHSQCFNCTMCKKNLEGQSFVAKGGRPYCKNHAR